MEFDRLPSRPVVKSTIGAQAEWERWLYENHFQRLMDGDGLDWSLELSIDQVPDAQDWHDSRYILTVQLSVDADAETLIKTGTLDPEADERILTLIGQDKIPMRMKPAVHTAKGEKEARDMMIQVLPELRESIAKSKLRDIKRGLVGRWIDDKGVFGARSDERSW